MAREYKKIIVARTDKIGDVVLSLPVFAALKKCFPNIKTVALVGNYTSDVARSSKNVDDVITYAHGESVVATAWKLRKHRADAIVVLFPRYKIAAASFLARIPIRVGTAYRWYSFLFNRRVHEHRKESVKSESSYNLNLLEPLGCSEKTQDISLQIDVMASKKIDGFLSQNCLSKFVVVHPGSGGSALEWGWKNFRELVSRIINALGLYVVVTGTDEEFLLCKRISEGFGNAINAAGRFSMLEFIALASKADLFVSNSTGPLHIAAAVGTGVIGLYPNKTPMTPARWAPLTENKIILTPEDSSDNLAMIPVEKVIESIQRLKRTTSE